jgi:hypothetical protein
MGLTLPVSVALPFTIVALAAVVLVVLESTKIFGRDVIIVVCNRWGWALLTLNIIVALLVYVIARTVFNASDSLGTALLIAFTFPIVLRSRFTYFHAAGVPETDWTNALSLKLDEFYNTLQILCMKSVRESLADQRALKADLLGYSFPQQELGRIIGNYIAAYQFDDPAEETKLYQRLNTTLQIPEEQRCRYELAMMLIDINPSRARKMFLDAQRRDTARLRRPWFRR